MLLLCLSQNHQITSVCVSVWQHMRVAWFRFTGLLTSWSSGPDSGPDYCIWAVRICVYIYNIYVCVRVQYVHIFVYRHASVCPWPFDPVWCGSETLLKWVCVCLCCYEQYKRPPILYTSTPHPPLVEWKNRMGEGNTKRGRTSQGELNFKNKNLRTVRVRTNFKKGSWNNRKNRFSAQSELVVCPCTHPFFQMCSSHTSTCIILTCAWSHRGFLLPSRRLQNCCVTLGAEVEQQRQKLLELVLIVYFYCPLLGLCVCVCVRGTSFSCTLY